jgi:uncharacterized protein
MSADTLEIVKIMALLLTIGGVSGFLSGLLGVGGGILFVPALFYTFTAFGYDTSYAMHIALGSSLAVVFAVGSTSAWQHYKRGSVDRDLLRTWGPFITGGVVFGSAAAGFIHGLDLKKIFAVVTLLIAIYMAFGRERKAEDKTPLRIIPPVLQRFLCTLIGMISSMIGVGGAILTIPLMSYTGLTMQRAIGTGAALGIMISLPGAIGYMATGTLSGEELPPFSIGYVNFLAVAMIIPASVLMAPYGVEASHSLPRGMLRRIFALVLAIVSTRMFITL